MAGSGGISLRPAVCVSRTLLAHVPAVRDGGVDLQAPTACTGSALHAMLPLLQAWIFCTYGTDFVLLVARWQRELTLGYVPYIC